MSDDWMDAFKEEVASERGQKEQKKALEQRDKSVLRQAIAEIFDDLEKELKSAVPTFNFKMFGANRRIELRYEGNLITGDHFLLVFDNLRYFVRRNAKDHVIEFTGQMGSVQHQKYIPASGFLADFSVTTTDGIDIIIREREKISPVTIDQLVQRVLTTLVRATLVK